MRAAGSGASSSGPAVPEGGDLSARGLGTRRGALRWVVGGGGDGATEEESPRGSRDSRTGRRPAGRRPGSRASSVGAGGGARRQPGRPRRGPRRGARRPRRWGRGAPRAGPGSDGVSRDRRWEAGQLAEPSRARTAFAAGGRRRTLPP